MFKEILNHECVRCFCYQDTPGYSDRIDLDASIKMTLDLVEAQNKKWLDMEQSWNRSQDLREVEDPRIDLCLFCLGPHRLKPSDLKFMYEVGKHVPIVPVVTKADTMTIREAGIYRSEVASKIANPMLPGIRDQINVFHFERDSLVRSGLTDNGSPIPPFLVIASNDINEEMNSGEPALFWPERRYPWGTAEAFNKEHSDLLSLRSLLFKDALEEINRTKRQRYEAWRRSQLTQLRMGQKLRRILLFTIVPAVLCLQIGRKGIKLTHVKNAVKTVVRVVGKSVPRHSKAVKSTPAQAQAAPPPPSKKGWF
jgi:septin family protein